MQQKGIICPSNEYHYLHPWSESPWGMAVPCKPLRASALGKLRCVETNPFSLPDLVSQGKILISRGLRRFITVSSKPLRGWGERKLEDMPRLQKVWKILLSAFSPLSLVQEVDYDVSVHESVVTWSHTCHRSTNTCSVENGPFGFQHAAIPHCSVSPRYLNSSKRSHPLYFVLTTKG